MDLLSHLDSKITPEPNVNTVTFVDNCINAIYKSLAPGHNTETAIYTRCANSICHWFQLPIS